MRLLENFKLRSSPTKNPRNQKYFLKAKYGNKIIS